MSCGTYKPLPVAAAAAAGGMGVAAAGVDGVEAWVGTVGAADSRTVSVSPLVMPAAAIDVDVGSVGICMDNRYVRDPREVCKAKSAESYTVLRISWPKQALNIDLCSAEDERATRHVWTHVPRGPGMQHRLGSQGATTKPLSGKTSIQRVLPAEPLVGNQTKAPVSSTERQSCLLQAAGTAQRAWTLLCLK